MKFKSRAVVVLKKVVSVTVGLAVLVGDVRRQGTYTPLIKDILNFPQGQIRSIIIKVQHNCVSDRRHYGKLIDPPIKHEYCVVFRKFGCT